MKLSLKNNIPVYRHPVITMDIYGLFLTIMCLFASFKIVAMVITIFIVSFNLIILIVLKRSKEYVTLSMKEIITKLGETEEKILISDIKKIVFYKTKWYYYLFPDNYAGEFIIFLRDEKKYNKIRLTNNQFKKVKDFINNNNKIIINIV